MLHKFKNPLKQISAMLSEIRNVKQHSGEPLRKWFVDDYFDLIVWYDKRREIIGFQLCYDKVRNQHALTWNNGFGYIHNRVDDGEQKPGKYKSSPVLVTDGKFDYETIAEIFMRESKNMDQSLAEFIYNKIRHYCD